jgi:hypothetical protein
VVQVALAAEPVDGGLSAIREIAAQLPDAASLEPGTMVAIADRLQGARKRSMLERMTKRAASAGLHRAARCTALLSKGYVRVGGGTASDKTDWAWGFAPRSAPEG